MKVYTTLVRAVLLYGAESWTLRKDDERKLQTLEMGYFRQMTGMSRRDRIRNESIISKVNREDIVINTIPVFVS